MPDKLNQIIRRIEQPTARRGGPESPVIIAAIDRITHAAAAKAVREIGAVGRNRRGAPNEIDKIIGIAKLEPVAVAELRAQVDEGAPPDETIRELAARVSKAGLLD